MSDAIADAGDRYAAMRAQLDRAITERDRAQDRNETLERTHRLWSRTDGFLPIVGVTCDGDGCSAALGVVGAKTEDAPVIANATVAMAIALRWLVVAGGEGPNKHYCPACKGSAP